jgi:hypothetical protein
MLNNGIKILRDSEHIESKRTIIVSGLGRSGTTSITGALFNSNLNMVSENVVKRTLDDWGIGTSLDDKDTQSIRKEVIRRNSKEDVWGFKWHMIQNWKNFIPLFRNPYVVLIFRDPLTIALRSQINLTEVDKDIESRSFEKWFKEISLWQMQLIFTALHELKCPTILVSYEKLISNPNLIVPTVLDFCGLNNSEESIKFINTSKNSYLDTKNSGGHWIDINR